VATRPTALTERPVPALYLERVAARSSDAESARALRALSTQLLGPLRRQLEQTAGYKLHIDTTDGDIPVTAVLTSA
jgi:hypothetical protein